MVVSALQLEVNFVRILYHKNHFRSPGKCPQQRFSDCNNFLGEPLVTMAGLQDKGA